MIIKVYDLETKRFIKNLTLDEVKHLCNDNDEMYNDFINWINRDKVIINKKMNEYWEIEY